MLLLDYSDFFEIIIQSHMIAIPQYSCYFPNRESQTNQFFELCLFKSNPCLMAMIRIFLLTISLIR